MPLPESELQQRVEAFARTLRGLGLRATHQRLEVYRELIRTDAHPDAETVYQGLRRRLPAVSRDTVYRTLATLEGHGLVRLTEVLSGPTRYDGNVAQHHHFICTRCGLVKDFYSAALDALPLPPSVEAFGRVEDAHVQVRGVCAACAKAGREARRKRRGPF